VATHRSRGESGVLDKWRKEKIGIALLLGLLVVVGIGLYADVPRLLGTVGRLDWVYVPLLLALTLGNYVLRFGKWHYYVCRLGLGLPWPRSLWIFTANLAMVITPGKAGELLKPYLVRRYNGTPMSCTIPIVVCERLTDGVAMMALACVGLTLVRFAWVGLVVLAAGAVAIVMVIQQRSLALRLLDRVARLPLAGRAAPALRMFYESAYTLLGWRPLLFAVVLSIVSWSGEGVAFFLGLRALGIVPGLDLLLKAITILSVATLVGSVTALPGGLGSTDAALLGLLLAFVTPSRSIAAAATLLIRFATLWFGVSLGTVTLVLGRRMLFPESAQPSAISLPSIPSAEGGQK